MNFEPLYELKNRLENVAIVGINLAKDDFRLQRAVEQIKEYSTVAKVFKQIYDMGQKLLGEADCDLFLDLLALLDAVLCTQATTYSGEKPQEIKSIAKSKDFYKELHYSELSQVVTAFTGTGGGRLAIIENALETSPEMFNDFRMKSYMIDGLSDKYSEIADRITRELKKKDRDIVPLLKDGFDAQGKKEMLARLEIIANISKEEENNFYKYCIENGNKDIKEFAIGALIYNQANIDYILDLTKTEKGRLKNKAFEALSYMNDSRAVEEWGKFLKKKPLDNIEYLSGTTQQWATDYLNDFIGEYITELKNKALKTAEEKRTVESEIIRIFLVILNKESEKTLLFCKELYPYNKYQIKRILSFYIAKDLNEEVINTVKELSKKYEGEFLEQEFLISLIKDKAETVYKNFSQYAGAGKNKEEIKGLFEGFFAGKYPRKKEELKIQENFRDIFQVILRMNYDEENKEYILEWTNMLTGDPISIKLNGFDKKWYDIIFNSNSDQMGNWQYYSTYNGNFRCLYNPDTKGLKEKFAEFYYNIILNRTPYGSDIEFLNKLEWTDYKDFLKGKIDIEKNVSNLHNRIRAISHILNEVPIFEDELIKQIEEILEIDRRNERISINLCESWLERLKSGAKVKEL